MDDPWITQRDVLARITDPEVWREDMVPVSVERISYLEYYVGYLLPLGPRQIVSTLNHTSWARDFDRARYRIGFRFGGHFLSRSFRRALNLTSNEGRCSDAEGQEAATHRSGSFHAGAPHIRESITFVRRDLLSRFLKDKAQDVLYCFRSHRFSERGTTELRLTLGSANVRAARWRYEQEFRDISDGQNSTIFYRDRMRTFSFLFGKSSTPSGLLTGSG